MYIIIREDKETTTEFTLLKDESGWPINFSDISAARPRIDEAIANGTGIVSWYQIGKWIDCLSN